MTRYDRSLRLLATALAGLAGFVDAVGYLHFGGFFVSFMSGNSTRLAVGLATRSSPAVIAFGLILSFVLGVIGGSLLGAAVGQRRRPVVLALVATGLLAAAGFGAREMIWFAAACMAMAMGAANAVFERDGEVSIGVTYMTGALVKAGQKIAVALRGGDRTAWWPYIQLWLGLVLGAAVGAWVHAAMGLTALWIAVVIAAACALVAAALDRRQP
jgi:uncharacterized membrane protein YoaK (UPF0700 family)